MSFRIAAVSFLNAIPLTEWFNTDECKGHKVISALPSKMSDLLISGEADVALLPVVEIFRGRSGGILAGTGIACNGNVDSVKLFSCSPLDDIDRLLADRGSRSSVALTQVLLAELAGIKPQVVEIKPCPGEIPDEGEAILVIGDRCFEYEKKLLEMGRTDVHSFDLGAMWFELTNLPFVFAAWAVGADFIDQWGEQGVNTLSELLSGARDFGLENLDFLAAREAANGRLGYLGQQTPEAIARYFKESLVYKLGDQEFAGIRTFHQLCIKHGLVPDQAMPRIL